MSSFTVKNQNRKQGKVKWGHEKPRYLREARLLRRALGGKFGNLDRDLFNAAVIGTTGELRS